ncbi:MAG: DUF2835 domain-containing protein [Bacterioplanes sp.]|nr:DUF2835 domain-containing protein [Bacterioplanes sp.]
MSQQVVVDLAISADEYLSYYRGHIKYVVATTLDGRQVRFPANILQKMVGHEGIYGRFAIQFDDQGKFQRVQRVER